MSKQILLLFLTLFFSTLAFSQQEKKDFEKRMEDISKELEFQFSEMLKMLDGAIEEPHFFRDTTMIKKYDLSQPYQDLSQIDLQQMLREMHSFLKQNFDQIHPEDFDFLNPFSDHPPALPAPEELENEEFPQKQPEESTPSKTKRKTHRL